MGVNPVGMEDWDNPRPPGAPLATAAAKFEHRKRVLKHLESTVPTAKWGTPQQARDAELARTIHRVELAISGAAYPDVHPDFTDAGWKRMAEAAVEAACVKQMLAALRLVHSDGVHRAGRISEETFRTVCKAHDDAVRVESPPTEKETNQ